MGYIEVLFGKCIAAMNALNLPGQKRTQIIHKLLDSPAFYSILPEIEALVYFYERGLEPVPEPMFPNVGPDFRVMRVGFVAFVEVASLAADESDRDFNLVSEYVHQKMEKTRSRYLVMFDLSAAVLPYSPLLKRACNAAKRFLGQMEAAQAQKGTLYVSRDGEAISFVGGDFVLEERDYLDPRKLEMQERLHGVPARVSYELAEVDQPGNYSMTTTGGAWLGGRDRIRGVLLDKLRQLPRNERNLIVVDWSYLSGTGEHDFLDALYGTSHIAYQLGGHNVREYRDEDGFFARSRRVQAVVALNRNITGELKPRWTVFPTNNAEAEGRMNLEQLRLFGEVQLDLERFAV